MSGGSMLVLKSSVLMQGISNLFMYFCTQLNV